MAKRTSDPTIQICNEEIVEVADIIWWYDALRREAVPCVFYAIRRDGWLRVKKIPNFSNSLSEWLTDMPQKFYASQQQCIDAEIERLKSTERLKGLTESA